MLGEIIENGKGVLFLVLTGIAILLIGFALGVLARKVVARILREIELNKILGKAGITSNIEKGVSSIVAYVIYLITIVLFLRKLGIDSIVLYLVLGGVLAIIILTFLVGLKDVIPNFIGWMVLQKGGKIKEGRTIDIREISGVVEKIGYLETEIKTEHGDTLYVPNRLFLKHKFNARNHH